MSLEIVLSNPFGNDLDTAAAPGYPRSVLDSQSSAGVRKDFGLWRQQQYSMEADNFV